MGRGLASRTLSWTPASHPTEIEPDGTHLWLVRTADLSNSLHDVNPPGLLSRRERERAARMSDATKRSLYVDGRAGLRLLIEAYTGHPARRIRFRYGLRGKPALLGDSEQLRFNYSVSSGYALYAFSMTRELGVDLEIHPRAANVRGLFRRILSPAERMQFDALPPSQHNDAMLDCWTRKEAYGKLLGVGIRYNMNRATLLENRHSDRWCSGVAGLFGDRTNGAAEERACGTQIGLPVPGSAALMYDVPDPARGHPDLKAFRWPATMPS